MKLWPRILLGTGLSIVALLAFTSPHSMLAPGDLIKEHAALTDDCFACHTPLRGVSSDRCITCHRQADIGRMTTQGVALTQSRTAARFHQELTETNCTACHSDHAGVIRLQAQRKFDHSMIKTASRSLCADCHQPPRDDLHLELRVICSGCHSTNAWKPASFDHARYFQLDDHHNITCVTCHTKKSYMEYSCYGCHEHNIERIRREHAEEGILTFDDCVKCHRQSGKLADD